MKTNIEEINKKLQGERILKFEVTNKNSRIYTMREFLYKREVCVGQDEHGNDIYEEKSLLEQIQERANQKRMIGCLGFPEGTETPLSQASHIAENIRIEEDYLVADIRVLDIKTENAEALKALVMDGYIVFRSRGVGMIREDSTVKINDIIAFDAIPKHEDTYPMIPDKRFIKRRLLLETDFYSKWRN